MGKVYSFDEFEQITRPPEDSSRVWRYMDLPKFANILVEKALHFTRASKLREGSDRFEGVWPEANIRDVREEVRNMANEWVADESICNLERFYTELAEKTYINCWHINDDKSYAMWKAYAAGGPGIEISTTFGRLNQCMQPYIYVYNMYRRKVAYIDNKVDGVPRSELRPSFLLSTKTALFQRGK